VLNYVVVFVAIYFFYDRYQKESSKTHEKAVRLNEQLSLEKEKVSQAQKILYSMIDHLPLIICMIDREGRFLSMNRLFARDYGFEVGDMIGRHYKEVMPRYFVDNQGKHIEKCLRGEEVNFDEIFELPFQQPVNGYGSCIPIYDHNGHVAATTFFAANVDEMKDKEHQLQVLNETKNKLFSIIAHDLRSPINLINGLVFMNKDEDVTEQERLEHTDRVDRTLKNLTVMLENLLMWARNQIEGHDDTLDYYNLKHLVEEELSLYDEMLESKKITLSLNIPDQQQVYTSESALRMIVRNIYTNALKFSNTKGQINVSTEVKGDEVLLTISDNGVGMSEELIEAIRSHKLIRSQSGTDGEQGAGIGLHLGLQLLHDVGGSYELESKEGKGTRFTLRLCSTYRPAKVYA
jgi:PAS domain S-box-containing protein